MLTTGHHGGPPSTTRLMILTIGLCAVGTRLPAESDRDKRSTTSWARHTIDDASRGADGVRFADINGDNRPDVVTGWEEGGRIRVCLQPAELTKRSARWPVVTVGKVARPEDAVFADLDNDGAIDVVSCCEGNQQAIFFHWAPTDRKSLLQPSSWTTRILPVSRGRSWMYALPLELDQRNGIDLVVGSKGKRAAIGWLSAPADARDGSGWTWHSICEAGWIMSLVPRDMDGDGDTDIVTTDRKGKSPGCFWLENPGPGPRQAQPWRQHSVGGIGHEVMFMTLADLDRDGMEDVVVAVKRGPILFLRRTRRFPPAWTPHEIAMPADCGSGKSVAVGDLTGDGRNEIVVTCEGADDKHGVFALSWKRSPTENRWMFQPISGSARGDGVKFDIVELMDLDDDGDPDIVTCEERDNLGVFWYENPLR